ncbi:hypothetical protein PSYMO_31237 [Pseudomonas amygdali pv. mori str. 301020]|uniref:Uncharacterized protein n=1 Tax=Pseudomonas amygdali pv. mori str. 301020 TaxID=629261 RepID=A0A656GJ57_PSEA0|nr:hypothetical protein PSYMO_31237 [Pseudomonas amygdali pv. mori str. 301020]
MPVRYALDRSRYDAAPEQLKPLPKQGQMGADADTENTQLHPSPAV